MDYTYSATLFYPMKYWVDAYNLIGQMEAIQLSDADKEDKLVAWFNKYLERQDRCVLVFDGQGQYNYMMKSQENRVEIIYTDPAQSADAFLIQKMETVTAKQCIWVSSDRELLAEAKRYGKKCLKCDSFLSQFLRRSAELDDKIADIGSVDQWLDEFS